MEFEGDIVYVVYFILEMEDVDKFVRICVFFFFWNMFCEDLGVFVEVYNWVVM